MAVDLFIERHFNGVIKSEIISHNSHFLREKYIQAVFVCQDILKQHVMYEKWRRSDLK